MTNNYRDHILLAYASFESVIFKNGNFKGVKAKIRSNRRLLDEKDTNGLTENVPYSHTSVPSFPMHLLHMHNIQLRRFFLLLFCVGIVCKQVYRHDQSTVPQSVLRCCNSHCAQLIQYNKETT